MMLCIIMCTLFIGRIFLFVFALAGLIPMQSMCKYCKAISETAGG